MAEAITDERVASVLRVFVRSTAPMLEWLRRREVPGLDDNEPAGEPAEETGSKSSGGFWSLGQELLATVKEGLASVRAPGNQGWSELPVAERTEWWVNRVGKVLAVPASLTGLAGALGDALPVQDVLGSAGQGILLCAIASEHGITDQGTRVRLLAAVLFDRDIDPATASGENLSAADRAADDRRVAELTEDMVDGDGRPKSRLSVKGAAKTLWKQGRMLLSIRDELEKRPQGRFYHKALGMLPVVGIVGDFLGENSALRRAAKAGTKWIAEHER